MKSRATLVTLGSEIRRTAKAAQFNHGNERLWIPLRCLVPSPGGGCAAPQWAIESARKFNTK